MVFPFQVSTYQRLQLKKLMIRPHHRSTWLKKHPQLSAALRCLGRSLWIKFLQGHLPASPAESGGLGKPKLLQVSLGGLGPLDISEAHWDSLVLGWSICERPLRSIGYASSLADSLP